MGHTPDRSRTVLVVDADPVLRELVLDVLRAEGVRVVAVANHAEALTVLKAVRFALILADAASGAAVAPGDPWPPLEAIRQAAGATPTVIFSAHDPDIFAGYAGRGFAGFIAKPFYLDALRRTVRPLITHATPQAVEAAARM